MKTAVCLIALCCVAMAQNFHGVSIGGTVEQPTLVNGSDNPLIGYAVERITDNGVNHFFSRLSLESIVQDTPLLPGREKPLSRILTGLIGSKMDHNTGVFTREGMPLRYELRAVLFANGTFVGPDFVNPNDSKQMVAMQSVFDEFSGKVSVMKTYAHTIQGLPDRYVALEKDRTAYIDFVKSPRPRAHNEDLDRLGDAATVADIVMTVKAQVGEAEADKALARIASLPDLKRGE